MTVTYVDVSHHDWSRRGGQLDWAAVRRATSSVMCARATYGDPAGYNPITRHFADFVKGAKAAGVDVCGGYHNLIAGDQASINRQVDWLRRELDSAGAVWAMLDVERYPELVTNGKYPRWDDVREFCARWHAVDRRVLMVYLPQWIWSGHLSKPDLRVLGCPLVASDYGSNPNGNPTQAYAARGGDTGRGWTAYGGVTPTIWQYGSNADCPGASGLTDVNAYRGTEAQLRALLMGATGGSGGGTGSETGGVLMALSAEQQEAMAAEIHQVAVEWRHFVKGWGLVSAANHPSGVEQPIVPLELLRQILGKVATIEGASGDDVDEAEVARQVVAGVLAGLSVEAIASLILDALPADVAVQVSELVSANIAARIAS